MKLLELRENAPTLRHIVYDDPRGLNHYKVEGLASWDELRKTGATVTVGKGQTILECARTVRQGLSFSCADGYCGTCETAVCEGEPEHRDYVYPESERPGLRRLLVCVSRSRTPGLVLDL